MSKYTCEYRLDIKLGQVTCKWMYFWTPGYMILQYTCQFKIKKTQRKHYEKLIKKQSSTIKSLFFF